MQQDIECRLCCFFHLIDSRSKLSDEIAQIVYILVCKACDTCQVGKRTNDALLHLVGRLIGEGDSENTPVNGFHLGFSAETIDAITIGISTNFFSQVVAKIDFSQRVGLARAR